MCNLNATFLFMAVVAKHVKILLFVIYVMALALCCFYDKSVTVAGLHSQTLKGLFALLNLEKNNKLHCSFYVGWRKWQFPLHFFLFIWVNFIWTMIKEMEILQLQPYLVLALYQIFKSRFFLKSSFHCTIQTYSWYLLA